MTQTRFIGDVHGKYRRYRDIIRDVPKSVQVGDMGVGFFYWDRNDETHKPAANPPFDSMSRGDHRFIRGNHDNPNVCARQRYWIPDGTTDDATSTMYVGGAMSIDVHRRETGYTYWTNEELSLNELNECVDTYVSFKPRIMVTHECPEFVASYMTNGTKLELSSRTRQAFEAMMEFHQPEIWIYGHWHQSFDQVMNGTRFICLAELEHIDLDI